MPLVGQQAINIVKRGHLIHKIPHDGPINLEVIVDEARIWLDE